MQSIPKIEARNGRCLALFSGAFRPPHINHYSTVYDLATRPEIDEVVIIVTNRCRNIPGTTKTLAPDVALSIWSIYLQNLAKVRVELAPKSAVKHALGYFDRVNASDSLLFCLGDSDGRFKNIDVLVKRTGIAASVIEGSPSIAPVRATHLREALAGGKAGRKLFMAALPQHLTSAQRAKVWSICRQGMKVMREIIIEKIRILIEENDLGRIDSINVARDGKTDEIFRVQLNNGTGLFVKYANDTVRAAGMGQKQSLKPRKRLKAERDAIKWLNTNKNCDIETPEVILFDKETRTLILTEVCPGGKPLLDDLKEGVFDPLVAREASRFLAECHGAVGKVEPLWDNKEADLNHWKIMLALLTVDQNGDGISEQIHRDLKTLMLESDKARENLFVNLDFQPKNILVGKQGIGVIDFELSSSVGDPAYDFGVFLGHYILWGLSATSSTSCQEALREALNTYRQRIGRRWLSMRTRVVAFAGVGILHSISTNNRIIQGFETRLLTTGATLLSHGLLRFEETDQILSDAAAGLLA